MLRKFIQCFWVLICAYFFNNSLSGSTRVYANNNTFVHLIFNKVSFEIGEEVRLTINLENFSNLCDTRIMIKCDEQIMVPLNKNGTYGQLTNSSIYEQTLVNDYVNHTYLRFQLIKENLNNGYYSGYKNNIGEFYFEARSKITNVYDYFMEGSFTEISTGINVMLFDINNQVINTNLLYSEKIKVKWDQEKYVIEVFDEIPVFLNDIVITNRNMGDFELIIEDNINNQIIGTQIVNVAIIDKTNSDYCLLSKVVEVKDLTAPKINGESSIMIDSNLLPQFKARSQITVTDNYDAMSQVRIEYYTHDEKGLIDEEAFINYLTTNMSGFITYVATDASGNASPQFIMMVNIKDTSPPNINELTEIIIKDQEVPIFNFSDYIELTDAYDNFPQLVFNAYVGNEEVEDYHEYLKQGIPLKITYFGIDNQLNITPTYHVLVRVLDTTSPIIENVQDLIINDVEVMHYPYEEKVKISDNIDINPLLVMKYYVLEENQKTELVKEEWLKKIVRGHVGWIEYYGVDQSKNHSQIINQSITVNDTTSPNIKIHNIKDHNKYIVFDSIAYDIIDNFDGQLDTNVTLNGIVYNGETVNTPGDYEFKIHAVDSSGNENTEIIHFTIIENNVIGCGNDIECYVNNYLEVVIIVAIIMITIITIFILKLFKLKRRKRKV